MYDTADAFRRTAGARSWWELHKRALNQIPIKEAELCRNVFFLLATVPTQTEGGNPEAPWRLGWKRTWSSPLGEIGTEMTELQVGELIGYCIIIPPYVLTSSIGKWPKTLRRTPAGQRRKMRCGGWEEWIIESHTKAERLPPQAACPGEFACSRTLPEPSARLTCHAARYRMWNLSISGDGNACAAACTEVWQLQTSE